MPGRARRKGSHDFFESACAPPRDETPEDRLARLAKEKEAKARSDEIDLALEAERLAQRKADRPIKILLLGQSESGKSTTVKNFQLMYEPKALDKERTSWRMVIQLNIVRSFRIVINALDNVPTAKLPSDLLKLKLRLSPLLALEDILARRLMPAGSDGAEAIAQAHRRAYSHASLLSDRPELAVRSTWKEAFHRIASHRSRTSLDSMPSTYAPTKPDWDADPEDPSHILATLLDDMRALWTHPATQRTLENQHVRLRDLAGFFSR